MKTSPPPDLEKPRLQGEAATTTTNVADKQAEQRIQALLRKERRRRQVELIRRKNKLVQLEKERRRYLLPGYEDNVEASVEKKEDPPQRRRKVVDSLEGAFVNQCKNGNSVHTPSGSRYEPTTRSPLQL